MEEKWKPVLNFDGYMVSDQGRCASTLLWRGDREWRILRNHIGKNGYVTLRLTNKEKQQKHPSLHRVVWEAFNGPIQKGIEINHKNGIKTDNRLENFELTTRSENMRHGFRELGFSRNRIKGPTHPKAKLQEADVIEILELRRSGMLRSAVAEKFNVSATAINLIEKGKNWQHLTGIVQY